MANHTVRIDATHESGSQISLHRTVADAARTIELLKQSGYVSIAETPLTVPTYAERNAMRAATLAVGR